MYLGVESGGREGKVGSLLAMVSDGTVRPGGLSVRGDVGHSDSRLPQPTIQLAFRNKRFQHFTVQSIFLFSF